ncbi:MAG: NfeD family protein [Thermoprotei archaeon]
MSQPRTKPSGVIDRILMFGIRPLFLLLMLCLAGAFFVLIGMQKGDAGVLIVGTFLIVLAAVLGVGFAGTSVTRRAVVSRVPEAMLGRQGIAKTSITPEKDGVILVDSELWSAALEGGERVEPGDIVVVVGHDGLKLTVKLAQSQLGESQRRT